MRAAVLVEPGRFEIEAVPRPEPGRDDVLVRIARTGICGTDIHIFKGNYAADRLPMIPGHEFTGYVAASGAEVTGLNDGQPVVVDMNIGCANCYWCRRNEVLNCPEMRQMGITTDGAFAEYISVPARLAIPAPAGTPVEALVLTEPLSCVVRAARKARVTFGQSVAVMGAGPIGNLHVQLLRTIGAAPIIVSDVSAERRARAREGGADVAVPPEGLIDAVMTATERRGADIVIESVGCPALYSEAKALVRKGGHIAAFGLTGAGETLALDILQTILHENSVKGSVAGMGQDMHDALTLLSHGRIDTEPFTGAEYGLEDIQLAFDTFDRRTDDLKTQIVM
ncbi:MAG: alcohol dehydrogenase catalytic domain-containing protein [Rhodobacter sp.]|nr:alcohol dehydrogenase catalytic domain-containing protein [Rhodobacter sp.]MCY4168973.1 alcohol dehydrogenase catalytic domain-containing protein [Rhodobacter sp.]MCY4241732.1 alcohol dehydrogenase catalytic domain-containing protein [Rhodobacter sp.]